MTEVSETGRMTRGKLRIYLGAAAGVGKTYAMLGEGQRRRSRGTDVAIGYVETHGRSRTAEMIGDLEVVPRRRIDYRGATFEEMDVDAVIARRPQVALVDELAHTNVPGSRNEKRWQDVHELLDAGIDVITTVNIQHLESLNDVVESITGVRQRETVPDAVVRAADQIELEDMTPEALRRRMAHGNVYPPEKIDAALSHCFRVGNLTALRELALLWLADKVDEGLRRYREQHGITATWEARERIVVALTGGPEGDTLIRRAARIADRAAGAELLAVHAARSDGLTGASPELLVKQRALVESLGGSYHQVVGDDVPAALLDFAHAVNATQLVLGASRRGRLQAFVTGPGIGATVTRLSGDIDVHIVTHEEVRAGWTMPRLTRGLTRRRRLHGILVAAVALPLLTLVLAHVRAVLNYPSQMLLYLLLVVGVALIGGLWPALLAAFAATGLLNWYFTPPFHTLAIADRNNLLALVVFVTVAVMVSSVVDLAARRTSQASRAAAEAETLSTLAGDVLRAAAALPALLDRLRETFGLRAVTLLERQPDAPVAGVRTDPRAWRRVAAAGEGPATTPDDGDADIEVAERLALVLRGRALPAADQRVLAAFAANIAVALERERLAAAAAEAAPLAEADRVRTALLRAVSHDLRARLASAKAAITSLRSTDITWSSQEHAELLATADESLDQLTALVNDLLDMSRLQAGALSVFSQRVALEEVLALALDSVAAGGPVTLDIPDDLPDVQAGLLQRIIANLVDNALRHAAPNAPPAVTASSLGGRVEVRVIDRGPGIPPRERKRVFAPFQRQGDRDNTTGTGLGLALARGLAEAMGGTLAPEDTPGGGLTMTLSLPAAPQRSPAPDRPSATSGGPG